MSQLIPTLHTQIQLNEIAKPDLGNQFLVLKETKHFHEKMRLYFYPKIFGNTTVNKENWSRFKIEMFNDSSEISLPRAFPPLLLSIYC